MPLSPGSLAKATAAYADRIIEAASRLKDADDCLEKVRITAELASLVSEDAGGVTFMVGDAAITLTGLAIAALCGVILNAILPGNDYEFGSSVSGDKSADLGSY